LQVFPLGGQYLYPGRSGSFKPVLQQLPVKTQRSVQPVQQCGQLWL
jgi:hypothetical protein